MRGDNLNHRVHKTAITRAIVDGTPATALCGARWVPTHQGAKAIPRSETGRIDFDHCTTCEEIHDKLSPRQAAIEEPDWDAKFKSIIEQIGVNA